VLLIYLLSHGGESRLNKIITGLACGPCCFRLTRQLSPPSYLHQICIHHGKVLENSKRWVGEQGFLSPARTQAESEPRCILSQLLQNPTKHLSQRCPLSWRQKMAPCHPNELYSTGENGRIIVQLIRLFKEVKQASADLLSRRELIGRGRNFYCSFTSLTRPACSPFRPLGAATRQLQQSQVHQ
jgi:hypothetical protein